MSSALLTMLNPRTASLEIGSGGSPAYTQADMSRALSAIDTQLGNKLGAAILCYIHSPDMAARQSPNLEERLCQLMHVERFRLMREEQIARIDYQIAKENYAAKNRVSRADEAELARLQAKHRLAKQKLWPERGDPEKVYIAIRKSILEDLRTRSVCSKCKGTKHMTNLDGLVVDCDECKGVGVKRNSMLKTSKKVGRHHSSFGEGWRGVYNFTYGMVNDAFISAERDFKKVTR